MMKVTGSSDNWTQSTEYYSGDGPSASLATSAQDRAYQRFVSEIRGESSQLAVGLAEGRQSLGMISSRALQLVRVARSIKQLRFAEAAWELGWEAKQTSRTEWTMRKVASTKQRRALRRRWLKTKVVKLDFRKNAKTFANNWLEFSFGWLPLVQDIYTSVDVLQRQYPSTSLRGRATLRSVWPRVTSNIPGVYYSTRITSYEAKAQIKATATISNPNLFRANQLGLVNPMTVAYELIPFSFVLNWFVNVEEFLNGYTDFTGVNLTNPFRSAFGKATTSATSRSTNVGTQPYGKVTFSWYSWEGVSSTRVLGLPAGPTLKVRPPWALKPWRAANAVSLLLQTLKPGR